MGLTFAALLLMAPGRILGLFGIPADETVALLARLLAAEFLGLSLVNLWAAGDRRFHRPVVRAQFFTKGVAGAAALVAVLGGEGNSFAWLVPATFLGFASVYGYLLVMRPRV